jgi:acyl transferase domain-containing protein
MRRRAGVSAFGIGGTNAHIVLEEAPDVTPSASLREAHLFVLSAKTVAAMEQATSNLAAFLDVQKDVSLSDVEWTLQAGRQAFSYRRALVVRDVAQAVDILREPQRAAVLTSVHDGGVRPVAFLFSGQGSQHVGMGAGLYRTERIYREAIDRCAGILEPHLGTDIRKVIFVDRGDARINETRLTQPALFVTEYALASLWRHWGITPKALLGHSIGEYVAAHLAGVLSLEGALKVVAARGRLMQELPSGSMAAVHLSATELSRWLGDDLEIAAVNAPALCAVSGPAEAITDLLRRLEAEGIESAALHTSHAFHSSMMEPALAPFTAVLKDITLSPPSIPYISNVTGTWITDEQATSQAYYANHLRRAVQFEAGVRTIAADSALFFLEVGPGNALTSMARKIVAKDRAKHVIASLSHSREERPDAEAILDAVGRLWLAGASVDWEGLHDGASAKRVVLPTYPFERKRYWVESALAAAPQRASGDQRVAVGVDEMLYAPTWTRDDSLAGRAVRMRGTWLVLGDQGPLADTVMALLTSAGAVPVLLERGEAFLRLEDSRFRVRAGVAEDIVALGREVDNRSPVAGAIMLWGVTDMASAKTVLTASSYNALVALAEGLEVSARGSPIHIVAASAGAQSVLDEPVFWPKAALAFGPVLVLPTEVPGLRMRSVDLELREGSLNIDVAARELVEEAASLDTEGFVARRAGRRWVRRFERLDLPAADAAALPLKSHGVYLITGGLGGIGLKLAGWLATVASARLLLTARTPLPPRANWDALLAQGGAGDRNAAAILAIREIELAGGEVITAAADAADFSAMQGAIKEARTRWGEIDGVIHSAGVPGNGRVAFLKDPQDFHAVVAPKIEGLQVLVQLLGDKRLDFVALMSSANALLGAPGACDYAAANAVLDAFAESRVRPAAWRKVIAFDWGAWREVGMAAKHAASKMQRAEREAFDEASFVPAAGVEAFARVLASGRSRVVVMPYDLIHHEIGERYEQQRGLASASQRPYSAAPESPVQPEPELSSPFAAPSTDLERRLAAIWTELLGVERIGVHDNFFELGGDSLLATRALARISQSLSIRLTLRSFFGAPTISRLAKQIGAVAFEARGTANLAADDREEIVF